MKSLYLDNAASTPMSKSAIRAVAEANSKYYANPFSIHAAGMEARKALQNAKGDLARELGVKSEEITLTSGGTESNAMALIGIAMASKQMGKNKIIISAIEHSSVYENAKVLEKWGFSIKEIPFSERNGMNFEILEKELDNSVALVSVMSVNSDTGILNDISRISKICKQCNCILHVDHSQGFGKMALQPKSLGVTLLTADAHKIGGPKGIGLLYVENGTKILPLFMGGEKNNVLKPGTQNVPAAIGFAIALKECKKVNWRKVAQSRDSLQEELEKIGGRVSGEELERIATHLHVCFKEVRGEELVNYLSTRGIYCSTGSACDSEKKDRRVLGALGVPNEYIYGSLRFSLSSRISKPEIKRIVKEVQAGLNRFKKTQN